MKEFKYVITDPEGIHARPAGELVKAAKEFNCYPDQGRQDQRLQENLRYHGSGRQSRQ